MPAARQFLVTGGLGFIGSRIVSALAAQGHSVRVLDHVPRDEPEGSDRGAANVEAVCGDITNEGSCLRACQEIDVVIHSAAVHLATRVTSRPLQAIETNVHGTLNVLRCAAAAGVKRFVFLSSAKVYGEPERLPSAEDDFPRPIDPYGLSKVVCEHYCERINAETGIETVVIRPFSVYGPHQDLNTGYIGMLVKALLDGEEPALPGQPSFLRDFVHVDDVVAVCTRAALLEGLPPRVLNAGSGGSVSLKKLIDLASCLTGRRILPTFMKPSTGTITRTQASIALIGETLGLTSTIPLDEGLRETLESFSVA